MRVKTTLAKLVMAEPSLQKVLEVKLDKEGGAKVRYHVVKLARLVAAETRHFHDERNALIMKYGAGEPPSVAVDSPKWKEFFDAVTALGNVEVEIPWGPMTTAMVEPYADVTASDLIGLGDLYELGEEK